ncbi:MAG: hypothetical protein ABFD50_12365 [Smithella sp.]
MPDIAYKDLKTLELLRLYADMMDELLIRGVVRTMDNPVAGYAEYLACKVLSLRLEPISRKGFDATGVNGDKFEIKSRRIVSYGTPNRFSAIRDIEGHHFDYLIAIIFESDFRVKLAMQLPYDLVLKKAKLQGHTNAWILPVRESSWNDTSAIDLTSKFADTIEKESS